MITHDLVHTHASAHDIHFPKGINPPTSKHDIGYFYHYSHHGKDEELKVQGVMVMMIYYWAVTQNGLCMAIHC